MKISIITVVYNRERTIEKAIQSVLSQSYPAIEYIVIDGASRDGTLGVIDRYRDRIATVVSEKDRGIYDALNKGISLATGEVVGLLHADDVFATNETVATIAAHLQGPAQPDAVYGDVGFVKEAEPDKVIRYYSSRMFQPGLIPWGFIPAHPTFFCYKKFFDAFGLYRTDLEIAADFELLSRFTRIHQLKTAYIPEMLVKMNLGGKSTKGLRSTLRINRELKQILMEQQLPSSYLRLYARYFLKVQEYWRRG